MVLALCIAACGGDDRPTDAEWRTTWEERRSLMPDADVIVARGAEVCDELVGVLRVELADLRPTPTAALDGPVDEWISLAQTVAFECPDDPVEAAEQLRTLDLIATEIDAGLAADDREP